MAFYDAYIGYDRTEKEMEGRVCTCPENPEADEWGDNSWLPCMSPANGMLDYPCICCKNCMYCQKKELVDKREEQ